VPESLHVELNAGSVHSIDAPRSFTAEGPFHIALHNTGGAVHVHLHLDDDLSRVSRVDEVNHYVEEGATKRIPIGVLPDRRPVTGRLKIVSGYGAEVSYVDLTVVPNATDGERAGTNTSAGETNGSAGQRQTASQSESDRARAGGSRPDQSVGDRSTEIDSATGATVVRRKNTNGKRNRGSSATLSNLSKPASTWESITRGLRIDGIETAVARARRGSPEAVVFLVLAAVSVIVGVGVILLVNELLLALVVLAVVAATVGVAGWLLLE